MPQNDQDSLAQQMPFPQYLSLPAEFARLAMHMIENQYLNSETMRLDTATRMQAK